MSTTGEETDPIIPDPDEDATIASIRAAQERAVKARKLAQKEAEEARGQVADLESKLRDKEVSEVFAAIGVKAKPGIYPKDREVTEEAVKEYLKAEMGFDQATIDAWGKVDAIQNEGRTVGPTPDPLAELLEKNMKSLHKLQDTPYEPSEKEAEDMQADLRAIKTLHDEHEAKVRMGTAKPLVDISRGFGGLQEPPAWAYVAEDRPRR